MVWFQVDDGMWSHPKMLGLSADAGWLWVRAGAYCAQHLTDGIVPPAALRILGATQDHVRELIGAGLWLEQSDGYRFHDWHVYQRTREKVEADRAAARERQAKARARKSESVTSPVSHAVSHAVTSPVTNAVSNAMSHTTRAEPSRSDPTTKKGGARKRATPPPSDFPITDEMRTWAAANAPGINLEAETLKMLDYSRANGKTYKDWVAHWRNWMRRAKGYASEAKPADRPTPTPPIFDASKLRPDNPIPMPDNVRQLLKGETA